jgi:hypothetical protein
MGLELRFPASQDCSDESVGENSVTLKANHQMTSCGEIKFWTGLLRGPGLPWWLPEYCPGLDRRVHKGQLKRRV